MDNLNEKPMEGEFIPKEEIIEDREYQDDAANSALKAIENQRTHPIIAVPTGGGKTHIIGKLIKAYLYQHPIRDIVVLSHVKEILEQDYNKITKYTDEPIGLYSSMLKSKTIAKITVAGIQSVYKKSHLFGDVGLIIIDECHLVTDEQTGMYRTFLAEFNANYVGLTATPFRPRGYLHKVKNALFTEICYDLTSQENFKMLIDKGYLCKLFSKGTDMKMDVSDIPTQGGDFASKALGKKFNTEEVTELALTETCTIGKKYKKWLIFAIDIDHAEGIRDWLNDRGINTGIVHSKMDEDRDLMLDRFRSGFYMAMVNVNVLTTGLDIPDIDLVVLLRPTKSPVIYAQSVGRGLRTCEGKDHCLVLDFAGNVARHGPVDSIKILEKGEKGTGDPVTKECPVCNCITHPITKVCEACGHEFEFKVNIVQGASELDILKKTVKEWKKVTGITVNRHNKVGGMPSIRIDYRCGLRVFSQWAAINSQRGAHSARYNLRKFYDFPEDFSFTIENVLKVKDKFRVPSRIFVDNTENYPVVEDIEFNEN